MFYHNLNYTFVLYELRLINAICFCFFFFLEDFSMLVNLLQEQITTSKYTNKLLEDLLLQNNNSVSTSGENGKKNEQQTIRENFRTTFPYLPANSVKDMLDMDREISQDESRQLMVIKPCSHLY